MLKDILGSAEALYDGGWRSNDKEELMQEYDLSEEDAQALCDKLDEVDRRNIKYNIWETYEEITDPQDIKEWCTADDEEPAFRGDFDTLEEAREELKKYNTKIRKLIGNSQATAKHLERSTTR